MKLFNKKEIDYDKTLNEDKNIFMSNSERIETRLKANGLLKGHNKTKKKNKKRKGKK